MNKITLAVLVLMPYLSFAQGNLQFNQVLDLTSGTTYTVPSGKVFKVESYNLSYGAFTPLPLSGTTFCCIDSWGVVSDYCNYKRVDSLACIGNICVGSSGSTFGARILHGADSTCALTLNYPIVDPGPALKLPIWLRSGQQINIKAGNGIQISGIEFNIIP